MIGAKVVFDGNTVMEIPLKRAGHPTVGWNNLDPGDKGLVDSMAREILSDMGLSMESRDDVVTVSKVLRESIGDRMSPEFVSWWVAENRRDIEPCIACGLRVEQIEEEGEWPYCSNCGMV